MEGQFMRPICLVFVLTSFLLSPTSTLANEKHKDEAKLVGNAHSLFESWQYKRAIEAYKKLIKESTDKSFIYAAGAEAHVRIGECLYHLERYDDALEWLSDAVKKYPHGSARYAPYVKLGDVFVKLGQIEKAKKSYKFSNIQHFCLSDIEIEKRIERLQTRPYEKTVDKKK
jgi:tetratricopeptide (TPR) repeat protein